ncbi:MAG: TolC family protein [Proteobacteria bacterium]|nr:TolC family protein [Pseudomonadota bacterium]
MYFNNKIFLFLFISVGCSVPSEQSIFNDVQTNVEQHINEKITTINSKSEEEKITLTVREILKNKLSVDSAIKIALLNNPGLQATYQELGIARAELLAASSIPNPIFSVSARFPSTGGGTNLDFGLTENFLSFIFIPLKKSVSESMLESAKAKVSAEVLSLSFDIKETYYQLQAALQHHELLQSVQQATEASYVAARAIHKAGNNTKLELQNEEVLFHQTKLEIDQSETEIRELREKLNILLGLPSDVLNWTMENRLPEVPKEEKIDEVEDLAIAKRFELASQKAEIEAIAKALEISSPFSVIADAEIGINAEKETSGDWLTGPNLSFPIPLFNLGRAEESKLQAEYNAALFRYHQQEIEVRAEARKQKANLISLRKQIEFIKNTILPLKHSIVKETQTQYNGMLVGVFTLLMAKQSEIEAGKQYILLLKDYWLAHVALERAVGTTLNENK